MIDGHVHIERGAYTLDWLNKFVDTAVKNRIDELWILEHCYRFREYAPMYDSVCAYSDYIDQWFHQKAGVLSLKDYLRLIETARKNQYPVRLKFGIEVCYFKEFEEFVANSIKDKGLDFVVGSVHYVDRFAFDHKPEHWNGVNVDNAYAKYFETSIELAESGIFNGIAHPDTIKLYGHKPSFPLEEYYTALAKKLAKNGMYAEQNSGAHRRYPDTAGLGMDIQLLHSLKAHGVEIITASDAHCPQDVGAYIPELCKLIEQA